MRSIHCLLLSAALAAASALPGQNIVRDLKSPTPGTGSSNPSHGVVMNGIYYFAAVDVFGVELWRTDGTTDGTWRVKDINPGVANSNPANFVVVGNDVFFTALVAGYGIELWATDGTTDGTRLVKDVRPQKNSSSSIVEMTRFKGKLFFSAFDVTDRELWVSDGTSAGTKELVDIFPGRSSSLPDHFQVMGNHLYFFANHPTHGRELFRTDGTGGGTRVVSNTAGSLRGFAIGAAGNKVFFAADSTADKKGIELYVSDGTAAGTKLVKDIYPGTRSSSPRFLTALGSKVVFAAQDPSGGIEPWVSDGTAAGTVRLADINAGAAPSRPDNFIAALGHVFFAARGPQGRELYKTNGTAAGTALAIDFGGGDSNPTAMEVTTAGLALNARQQLWVTNGTYPGTTRVNGVSSVQHLRAFGKNLLFSGAAPAVGRELYWIDDKLSGLRVVRDIGVTTGNAIPTTFAEINGKLFFSPRFSDKATESGEPFVSGGTVATTFLLEDLLTGSQGSRPTEPVLFKNELWFLAAGYHQNKLVGNELFKTDGTRAGTGLGVEFRPGIAGILGNGLTPAGGKLYLQTRFGPEGSELAVTDGTQAGTRIIDINAGTRGSFPTELTDFAGACWFAATNDKNDNELWRSDGTVAGTKEFIDLYAAGSSSPGELTVFAGKLYFAAYTVAAGRELMVTDGTVSGTKVAVDLLPGTGWGNPRRLFPVGNKLFFLGVAAGKGNELHVSDGTQAGTKLVKDIRSGAGSPVIHDMIGVNGRLFFLVDDNATGIELWTSDGTSAGTKLVKDIQPGFGNGVVKGTLTRIGSTSVVAFAGSDLGDGLQVWSSDGTAANTRQLGKIGPRRGSGSTGISQLRVVGSTLFFDTDAGIAGRELWRYSLTSGNRAFAEAYGTGCYSPATRQRAKIAAQGLPSIGNLGFAVDLSRARPSTASLLFLSHGPSNLSLGIDCSLRILFPLIPMPAVPTDSAGFARTPLPIPNEPSLVRVRVFGQYLVVDPGGRVLRQFTLSDGLQMFLGN